MTFDDVPIASAAEHLQVTDALLRFGAGVDRADPQLLASAFTADATVNFGPCGRALGLDFPTIAGREAVVAFLAGTGRTQTTSHVVTNARVRTDGTPAKLRALVDATHVSRREPSRRLRMMNWYALDLLSEAPLWKAALLVIENVWFTGDPNVLMDRG